MLLDGCHEGKHTPRLSEVRCPNCGEWVEVFVQMGGAIPQLDSAEIATDDVNEMLEILIQKSFRHVGVPVSSMTREDKIKGLQYLDNCGAFLIKKSSDRVAQCYEISRFSLYNYLDIIRNGEHGEE